MLAGTRAMRLWDQWPLNPLAVVSVTSLLNGNKMLMCTWKLLSCLALKCNLWILASRCQDFQLHLALKSVFIWILPALCSTCVKPELDHILVMGEWSPMRLVVPNLSNTDALLLPPASRYLHTRPLYRALYSRVQCGFGRARTQWHPTWV